MESQSLPSMVSSMVSSMRSLFTYSQHLHKHQKCLKQINQLYEQYSKTDEFKCELIRNIKFTLLCDQKSPFTKHSIEFLSIVLRSFCSTNGNKTEEVVAEDLHNRSDQENCPPIEAQEFDTSSADELGLESLGSESFTTSHSRRQSTNTSIREEPNLTDIIIEELLIKYLYSINTGCRYNTCVLIRKLFTDLEDIDTEVFNRLKRALLDRCADKEKSIRSVAALALHRFQEVEDPKDLVMSALKFHLKNDPDFYVRQSCLQSLHPTNYTIDEFIYATRDVKDIIRKTAFTLIAEKFQIRSFEIDKRLLLLKNGLNERSPAVKRTFQMKLLPNWVKTFNGDVVALLFALDIQSDPELIEKMLYLYFDHICNEVEDNGVTAFHKLMNQFKDQYLDKWNLITKVELTVEKAFLWRILAKYAKEKDITISVHIETNAPSNEDMIESDSQQSNQIIEEKMDAIDIIIPDLPHYCTYLEIFVKQVLKSEYELQELMEFEFMFNQLLFMGQLLEVGDEAQRQILRKCLNEILLNEQLFTRIHNYIPNIMKIFSLNSDSNMLLDITVGIIDSINTTAMEVDEPIDDGNSQELTTNSTVVNTEQLRQFELEYAKISVKINELRDGLDSAKQNDDFMEAKRIKDIIDGLTKQKNDIMEKRLMINSSQATQGSQTTQSSQVNEYKTQRMLSDDPLALERCVQIFCGSLEFGSFKEINAVLLTLIERLVIPSITTLEMSTRSIGIKCLGLSCLISIDLAKKYFALFVQILNFDSDEAQENALKSILDFLCIHGLSYFEQKANHKLNSDKQNKSHLINEENKENRTQNSQHMADNEEEDNDITIIDNEFVERDSENNIPETNNDNDGADDESFITLFTELLVKHLYSESDELRLIVAKGIGKLFILGRMYSPPLLSKLIILWYDIDSSEEMRQFLGVFLPIYSGIEMKSNLKGQNAFEECFILTVETVYTEALNYVNLDNMINFLIELISDEGHKNLALSIANRIITLSAEHELSTKYYLRVLAALRLNEMLSQDVKEFRLLIKRIEKLYKKLKGVNKSTLTKIETIKLKIKRQKELINHNSSQVSTIEDFGSQSLSQSLSERSQIVTPVESPVRGQ